MADKIMQVFYGNDCLPYKDRELTVHFPIIGCAFTGSHNYNKVHFYVNELGGVNSITWLAVTKLPNGRIIYQVLTPTLDSDNNYCLELDLSQFYTQIKGDIYISLNGCDGEVEISEDDETNIQTIEAVLNNQTIIATGSIKISMNYAVQRPLGFSFDIDQYQDILDALSGKANVINTIQVVDNITTYDLSSFDNCQLFYDMASELYYEKIEESPYYKEVDDFGLLASDYLVPRFIVQGNETCASIFEKIGGRVCIIKITTGGEYLAQLTESKIVLYSISDNRYYVREDLGGMSFEISSVVNLTYAHRYLDQKYTQNNVYGIDNGGNQVTIPFGTDTGASKIVQRDSNGQINVPLVPTSNSHSTSKKYVDDMIRNIEKNAFIIVDTETYPTLEDFLEDDLYGEEGFIYLYPIDTSDLTKGYYQYIWENESWLDIGTTQIDLSNYYTKAQVDGLLLLKANDNEVVKLTGNQAISGSKLFTDSPSVPTPTFYSQATNKDYVDTEVAKKVDKTNTGKKVYGTDSSGNQITFDVDYTVGADGNIVRRASGTSQIMVPLTPTANGHATSKKYVDDSVASAISSVYRYKGSKTVLQINALTGMVTGDVYNVSDSGTLTGGVVVVAGDNVAWNGSGWDKLAGDIDLSDYVEKSQTIAGIDLSGNISAQDLTNALVYATTSDIENIMED